MIQSVEALPEPEHTINLTSNDGNLKIDTGFLQATFDHTSGLLFSLVDTCHGREVLRSPGIVPLVIEDEGDTWANEIDSFPRVVGEFHAADPETIAEASGYHTTEESRSPVRIIEKGSVRVVVETVLSYHKSTIVLEYRFYPKVFYFEISMRVNWNETRRMLKLSLPTTLDNGRVITEVTYGAEEVISDGTEQIGQRWLLLQSDDYALGLTNTGQYGFDVREGNVRLSILRSPSYCHWGSFQLSRDRTYSFMDMGEHDILLGIVFGNRNSAACETIRYANQLNVPIVSFPFFSANSGIVKIGSFIAISPETVVLSALKKSEDGNGYIVRIQESVGSATVAEMSVHGGKQVERLHFGPYEVKSLRLTQKAEAIHIEEVDLLERQAGNTEPERPEDNSSSIP
jgi:alpha-mannosidase